MEGRGWEKAFYSFRLWSADGATRGHKTLGPQRKPGSWQLSAISPAWEDALLGKKRTVLFRMTHALQSGDKSGNYFIIPG